jgi:hypothetical protein
MEAKPIESLTVSVPPPEKKRKKPYNGWTAEQEDLVANWADVASCYRILHDKTSKRYQKFNLGMTIPVIILSTLTGTANFGMGSFFGNDANNQRIASLAIGGFSLVAGLMTTLGNNLRFAQNMESHRVSAVSWGKYQRSIAVELALHPNERQDSIDFIKICRAELDRLIEQSPEIPDKIIADFERMFNNVDLKKPDVCNYLERTYVYRTLKRAGPPTDYVAPEDEFVAAAAAPVNPALSRIQSFVVKSRSTTPRNVIDITGISHV